MSQLAIFALEPYERQACTRLPSAAEQQAYRDWVDRAVQAIGDSRIALILQPDLPFTSCLPGHSRIDMRLVSWAAKRFSALPHTTVYLDAAASDWLKPEAAAKLLISNGVRSARGFATNLTHYASTTAELSYGHKILAALARRGVHGKHFVVSTSENGTPFTFQKHPDWFHHGLHDALGIPPTTDVANPRWGLPRWAARIARRQCDAYMWIARPWLLNSGPFELDRALRVAASTPKRYL
jgi:endoglucanase